MPKLTIDGQEIEVAQGTTVLQAALGQGLEIPHYCYHPDLSIAGNCRMCLVEIEKAPKLLIACDTRVQDGMVVHTDNDRVRQARAAVQEFLLINHPLDCSICDQAGECTLQNYAVEHGTGISRYVEVKNTADKAVDIGTNVVVVGGGDTAIDAARVALRQIGDGGKVTILYRRTRTEMPAIDREVEEAMEENVDIVFLAAPAEVVRDDAGIHHSPANRSGRDRTPGRRTTGCRTYSRMPKTSGGCYATPYDIPRPSACWPCRLGCRPW